MAAVIMWGVAVLSSITTRVVCFAVFKPLQVVILK